MKIPTAVSSVVAVRNTLGTIIANVAQTTKKEIANELKLIVCLYVHLLGAGECVRDVLPVFKYPSLFPSFCCVPGQTGDEIDIVRNVCPTGDISIRFGGAVGCVMGVSSVHIDVPLLTAWYFGRYVTSVAGDDRDMGPGRPLNQTKMKRNEPMADKSVMCADLGGIQHPSKLNSRISVVVRVLECPPIKIKQHGGKRVNFLSRVRVQDRTSNTLDVLGVVGNDDVALIDRAAEENREIELTAEVVQAEDQYALQFLSARRIVNSLQLIGATDAEIAKAKTRTSSNGLLADILRTVSEILGVSTSDSPSVFQKAATFAVLQSVSHGLVSGTPARLHGLLVGPPALGKGLLMRIALLVSLAGRRISSNSVTPAGLIGWVERTKDSMRYYAGALALADHGVATVEDLQHIDTFSTRHTHGIFCDVMEMGRLIRTTYRSVDIAVETALLMDINPKSTVRPTNGKEEVYLLDDLGLPLNLLSRTDVVFVFSRDVQRQIKLMERIVNSTTEVGPANDLADDPRVRELKVLIAHLRDLTPTISVESVREAVNKKLSELLDQNREKLESLRLASDFLTRGVKTVLKLIAASARLHCRAKANNDDVALAFDLFEEKMRFVSLIEPSFEHVKNWKATLDAKRLRQRRIVEHHAGNEVTVKVLHAMFRQISDKTLVRDLKSLGAEPAGKGTWRIPDSLPASN